MALVLIQGLILCRTALLRARHEAVMDSLRHGQLRHDARVHFLFDCQTELGDIAEVNFRASHVAIYQQIVEACRRGEKMGASLRLKQLYLIMRNFSLQQIEDDRAKVEQMELFWETRLKRKTAPPWPEDGWDRHRWMEQKTNVAI